jgi:hypothetical protein
MVLLCVQEQFIDKLAKGDLGFILVHQNFSSYISATKASTLAKGLALAKFSLLKIFLH